MDRLQELLEQISIRDYVNLDRRLAIANEIISLARQEGNTEALCKAYIEIGYIYLTRNEFGSCNEYARLTIDTAIMNSHYSEAGVGYNMLGTSYSLRLFEPESMIYFHKALEYFRRVKDNSRTATAYMNIGNLYFSLGAYEEVRDCYEAAKFFLLEGKRNGETSSSDEYYEAVMTYNLSLVYLETGEFDECRKQLAHLYEYRDANFFCNFEQNINNAEALYAYKTGDEEGFIKWSKKLIELVPTEIGADSENIMDYIKVYDGLLEKGHTELAQRLLLESRNIIDDSDSPSIAAMIYKRLLAFYRETGDTEGIDALLPDYYHALLKVNDDIDSHGRNAFINIIEEDELAGADDYFDNDILENEDKSYYDYLTGVGNRRFLRSFELTAFVDALEYKTEYSVIVMDIDSFREFNIETSYISGDICLQLVAKTISECAKDSFTARFGGDEFFVISTGINAARTRELCEQIRSGITEELKKAGLTGKKTEITLSMGYYSAIPEKGETHYDFVNRADSSLYYSKKEGRGGIKGN